MRRALALLSLCAGLLPAPASARRGRANQLLRVVEPVRRAVVSAHPFVNVIVRFGSGSDGTADPGTFRARLGGVNVTPLFTQTVENGTVVGVRAALGPAHLVLGTHRANRLRAKIRGRSREGRPIHDVDVVRFRAVNMPDQAPIARALVSTDVLPEYPGPV